MNYVVTFTDSNCIQNILQVWLPTLTRNFSGTPVVITFKVDIKDINKLKQLGATVIEGNNKVEGLYDTVANRMKIQEEFTKSVDDNSKLMFIDGADIVFQSEINTFFDNINHNKIIYSALDELSNQWTIDSFKKLTEHRLDIQEYLLPRLKKLNIKSIGLLAGTKKAMVRYFQYHNETLFLFKPDTFFGMNQMILTYLNLVKSEDFVPSYISNFRLQDKNVIYEDGLFKTKEIIPIAHFSRPHMKKLYNKLYLEIKE